MLSNTKIAYTIKGELLDKGRLKQESTEETKVRTGQSLFRYLSCLMFDSCAQGRLKQESTEETKVRTGQSLFRYLSCLMFDSCAQGRLKQEATEKTELEKRICFTGQFSQLVRDTFIQ
jgi:hypothetical protein